MKKRLARFFFLCACVGSVANAAWCVAILLRHQWFPKTASMGTTLFGFWAILLAATFWRPYLPKFWDPVLRVTSGSIRVARVGLSLILMQLVISYLAGFLAARADSPARDTLFFFSVGSLFLLGSAYAAAHWALRPENLKPSMTRGTSAVRATVRRVFIICIGLVAVAIGLIGRIPDGSALFPWRRGVGIIGGLFFIYNGSMYYFPNYRKKRAELDQILDESESESPPVHFR